MLWKLPGEGMGLFSSVPQASSWKVQLSGASSRNVPGALLSGALARKLGVLALNPTVRSGPLRV